VQYDDIFIDYLRIKMKFNLSTYLMVAFVVLAVCIEMMLPAREHLTEEDSLEKLEKAVAKIAKKAGNADAVVEQQEKEGVRRHGDPDNMKADNLVDKE
jgi:uncharacterized membrane protein YciS (DUF1049 family)